MAEAGYENVDPNLDGVARNGTRGAKQLQHLEQKKSKPSRQNRQRRSSVGLRKDGRHFGKHVEESDSDEESKMSSFSNTNDDLNDLDDSSDEDEGTERMKSSGKHRFRQQQDQRALTTINGNDSKKAKDGDKKQKKSRRRRRSSARFLRLSGRFDANNDDDDDDPAKNATNGDDAAADNLTSSEHLGEIYRQAIRMNAENKINAGNSWGLKLIENMDKFIGEDDNNDGGGHGGNSGVVTPRGNDSSRKKKMKDEKGRVNFTKASCTLDASVKIYSYRVDDVHLSSYRVLANLNRTDNKKDNNNDEGEVVQDGEEGGTQQATRRRNGDARRNGPTETIETNLVNINMSKLDSAYDIDPLFHKMSKSFDEGGAKGLLLGNLGVSSNGCHIVFDSKEELDEKDSPKLDVVEEKSEEDEMDVDGVDEVTWKESEIDITALSVKLESMLHSYGARTSDSVPFVPQLESLRHDYSILEEEGFAVDENVAAREGRKRSNLYDVPEEEEKEAEKSIHHIALERSRGSVLGTSFDTNFRLSLDSDHGEGEFAPVDFDADNDDGGEDFGDFMATDDVGFEFSSPSFNPDLGKQSYKNTKVLLDALCDGDAFLDGNGANSDYAFFDMSKFEKVTDGNLWAGSQHWKKVPGMSSKKKQTAEKKKVAFNEDIEEKKEKKKSVRKDRIFVDFNEAPSVSAIFEKKKTTKRTKKASSDPFQLAKKKTEVDFLLPPDANVDLMHLTRLFSRPNAVVRRNNNGATKPLGKTVGFYDIEENGLGFENNNSFGDDGEGFNFDFGGGDVDEADYNLDNFDEVRKVQKVDITYATVAKKVDVRRLKKDLWAELEEKTAVIAPQEQSGDSVSDLEEQKDDTFAGVNDPKIVSFKDTVEKMELAQSQNDVTVSFYFICCLHLANEKGLKLESTGLEDFIISLDDGSESLLNITGADAAESTQEMSLAESRGKRDRTLKTNYVDEEDEDSVTAGSVEDEEE